MTYFTLKYLHVLGAAVLLGDGLRPFDTLKSADLKLEQQSATSSALATHITYRVKR